MRRKDREIVDEKEIHEILRKAEICHIALCEGDTPYIVTLNFGVDFGNPLKIYFHCANEDRKLDIIKRNNKVCFQADVDNELNLSEIACKCSTYFNSVIAFGTMRILTDRDEKKKG